MLAYFFIQNCFKCDHDHNLVLSVIMTIAKFSEWIWPLQHCCVWQSTNNLV